MENLSNLVQYGVPVIVLIFLVVRGVIKDVIKFSPKLIDARTRRLVIKSLFGRDLHAPPLSDAELEVLRAFLLRPPSGDDEDVPDQTPHRPDGWWHRLMSRHRTRD